ncbi:uncharacterized protein LOC116932114 isoform X1 [Daphnia magna]|uniref:uncharacterized protein LOC116932114 isoform X1 n=1 Tax=Daphnia magna TaxID=35525 RepID=UPI001E1BACD8|nr:uncharacterized protein LOC116932114 isoform X1 [Daphnia magna]XP_032795746.2 uncharacterized protein LOC116932114 isoform X1 [Daphnia magna]XP_032795749.2 uncharacterized protein LOC116932114 isoform X1 [Daphnia magna]
MARKIYDPSENENSLSTEQGAEQIVDSQLQTQSRELYANFVREEIQLQGLPVPHVPSLDTIQFSNPLWVCNASSLRQLANEFSLSPLRNEVCYRAQSVDLTTLNGQNFSEMIQEVFSGGSLTKERILVVFFFCSDVALFALQNHTLNLFCKLIQWSTDYITGKFSNFICSQGGWTAVLNSSMNTLLKMSATAACCVAVIAMLVFIRNNWK